MRRFLVLILIFLGLLAIPILARQLRFYKISRPDREEPPVYEPADVPAMVPTPAAGVFEDEPDAGQSQILLDMAHDNDFTIDEISELDRGLAARGAEFTPYENGDLGSALRAADAYIVIAPLTAFTQGEVLAVADFVERGGRLLLVGDPTRLIIEEDDLFEVVVNSDEIPLNSLANAFDVVFNGDYLYNTVQNEGNFRNIILDLEDTRDTVLTEEVDKLAFYGAHSVAAGPEGQALLLADDNTWSSATDRPGGLSLAVLASDERVLALGDLDFLDEPYSAVYDNGRFIAHIADFLVGPERQYQLEDFPYFFRPEVDLVFVGGPEIGADAFDEIIALQDAFRRIERSLALSDEASSGSDVLYLGLYNQAQEIGEMLADLGITLIIDPPIEEAQKQEEAGGKSTTDGERVEEPGDSEEESEEPELVRIIDSDLGKIQMSGTSLILRTLENDQNTLIVLTASAEGLENTVDRLIDLIPTSAEQGLSDCLLQVDIALCPTGVADEPVEMELKTGGLPDVTEEEPAAEEEEEEEEEPPVEEEEETGMPFDAEVRGEIAIDEEVEDTLEPEQSHAWIFNQGPAILNIILIGDEEMDGILELYNPDGELIGLSDSSFAAGVERLDLANIPTDGDYTIVVRDFFADGGGYTLAVESVGLEDLDIQFQGSLAVGESAAGSLEEGDIHAWEFEIEEPVAVTITLEQDSELDGVLALFDPDANLVIVVDESGPGEDEIIDNMALEEIGTYTIIVAGYDGAGGDYTLILE